MHHTPFVLEVFSTLPLGSDTPKVDTDKSISAIRTLILALIGLALLGLTFLGLILARKGNPARNAAIVGAVLIALVPLAIAVGVGAATFGSAIFNWLFPWAK